MNPSEKPQDGATDQDGIWCVVANIKRERPAGAGGHQIRSGTKQFRGGTKVYLAGCYAGTCNSVVAIGLHRHSGRFITCIINVCHVEHFRVKLVYHPKVLDLIRRDERCWIRTGTRRSSGPPPSPNGKAGGGEGR